MIVCDMVTFCMLFDTSYQAQDSRKQTSCGGTFYVIARITVQVHLHISVILAPCKDCSSVADYSNI